ncbi:MAG: hypothetical protein WCF08_01170 [Anaerolineaceae bacterium]
MSADLDSLTARVAEFLQDATHLVYPDSAITEGLRQALGELSRALGQNLDLSGLDGAVTTTLPEELESLLVQGATAVVVSGRGLRHAEQTALAPEGLSPAALAWAEAVWKRFSHSCELIRSSALRGSSVPWAEPPAGSRTGWSLDAHDGEVF